RVLARHQYRNDQAKALLDQVDDTLLGMKYLPKDRDRHLEITGKYEDELDQMAENVGTNYASIRPQLDRFTRKLKREMNHGELAAQQTAYAAAAGTRKLLDAGLAKGTYTEEGYKTGLNAIAQHQTIALPSGGYSQFQPYYPSTMTDPIKHLHDNVDEINPEYDEYGQKVLDRDRIMKSTLAQYETNSALKKAMAEQGLDPIQIINNIIDDKAYQEIKDQSSGKGGSGAGHTSIILSDVGAPRDSSGNITYAGGSAPVLKDIMAWATGKDSWKESRDWINSEDGKRVIDYMQWRTGEKIPEDAGEASKWIQDKAFEGQKGRLILDPGTPKQRNAFTSSGQLRNPEAPMRDKTGKLLDADTIKAKLDPKKAVAGGAAKQAFVAGVVRAGGRHMPGSIAIVTPEGEYLFMEPYDIDEMKTKEWSVNAIEGASFTNTGELDIETFGGFGKMAPGKYTVRHNYKKNRYDIYQGGELRFVKGGTEATRYQLYNPNNTEE
ncbi:MAG: hypothetical protein HKN39_05135, partial [Flavobacteriales bacterium]|nr:hypothetical protein [Flavobacteriales bacterium]